jgi:hypothetical protein
MRGAFNSRNSNLKTGKHFPFTATDEDMCFHKTTWFIKPNTVAAALTANSASGSRAAGGRAPVPAG